MLSCSTLPGAGESRVTCRRVNLSTPSTDWSFTVMRGSSLLGSSSISLTLTASRSALFSCTSMAWMRVTVLVKKPLTDTVGLHFRHCTLNAWSTSTGSWTCPETSHLIVLSSMGQNAHRRSFSRALFAVAPGNRHDRVRAVTSAEPVRKYEIASFPTWKRSKYTKVMSWNFGENAKK